MKLAELLKLGIEVAQSTVAKYMAKSRHGPQGGAGRLVARPDDGAASRSRDRGLIRDVVFSGLSGFRDGEDQANVGETFWRRDRPIAHNRPRSLKA